MILFTITITETPDGNVVTKAFASGNMTPKEKHLFEKVHNALESASLGERVAFSQCIKEIPK